MGDSPQYSSSMANPIPLHPSLGGSKARCQVPHRRSPSCALPLFAPFSPTLVGDTRADRGGRVTFTFIGRRSERRQGYIEVMDSGVTIHACPCLARSASRVSYSQQQTAPGEDAFVRLSNLSAAAKWSNVVTGEVKEVLPERGAHGLGRWRGVVDITGLS